MQIYLNAIVEGELEPSISASEPLARAGLGNVLRLHRVAGRQVINPRHESPDLFEVHHADGTLHARYWLSRGNEGSSTAH